MPSSTSPSSPDRKANGNSKAPEQSVIEKSNPKRKFGEEIDDIFKTLGNKKKINKNKNKDEDEGYCTQKKKRGEESSSKKNSNEKKKKMNSEVDDDKKGKKRRKTTDGMTIYTAEELGIGNPDAGGMSEYTRGGCSGLGPGSGRQGGCGSYSTPQPAVPTYEEMYRYIIEQGHEIPPSWLAGFQPQSPRQTTPPHPIPDVVGLHSQPVLPPTQVPDTQQHPYVDEGAYAEGGQLATPTPSRHLLQLLPNGTFLNSHSITREITSTTQPRYADECSSAESTAAYYGMPAGGSSFQPSQPYTDPVLYQRIEQLSQQMGEIQDTLTKFEKITSSLLRRLK